jgi:superfamily II DNA helicase RecQ
MPIPNEKRGGIVRGLLRHNESRHKDRPDLKLDERTDLFEFYMVGMNQFAKSVAHLDEEQLKAALAPFLEREDEYPYCEECKSMVHSLVNHKHPRSCCKTMRTGCCTKLWKSNTPKIVPFPLVVDDAGTDFSPLFWSRYKKARAEHIASVGSALPTAIVPALVAPTAHVPAAELAANSQFLSQLYESVTDKLDASQDNTIHSFPQSKFTDLWLQRCGWTTHLQGYNSADLFALTVAPTDTPDPFAAILESVDRVIDAAYSASRKVDASNMVLYNLEEERESNCLASNKAPKRSKVAFQAKVEDETRTRYNNDMKKVVRVIFGMWVMGDDNQRPNFVMPDETQRIMERLCPTVSAPVPSRAAFDGLVQDFLFSLYCQPMTSSSYDSVMISALAVCGLKKGGGFVAPQHYTHFYAAIIKIIRWLVLGVSFLEVRAGSTEGLIILVNGKMDRYMLPDTRHNTYPLNWIYRMLSYGLAVAKETAFENHVLWNDSFSTVSYHGISFDMAGLRNLVKSAVDDTKKMLLELLFVDNLQSLPRIQWENAADDHSNLDLHYSFLTDERNTWIKQDRHFAYRQIMTNGDLLQQWTEHDESGAFRMRPDVATNYDKRALRFRKHLLALVYLTGGQSMRATELINICYKNTASGGIRNVFLDGGLVNIYTKYHKGAMLTDSIKPNFHHTPREVGELLVYYLWMVVPWLHFLQGNPSDRNEIKSPFLFALKLVVATMNEAKFIHRDELTNMLGVLFKGKLNTKMNVRAWRHIQIAISRKHLRGYGALFSMDESEDDPYDLQSGHTTAVANMIYGREIGQMSVGTADLRQRFRCISEEWHAFLEFAVVSNAGAGVASEVSKVYKELRTQRLVRLGSLSQPDLLVQLQVMMGNDQLEFRGKQLEALECITRHATSTVLQIAPTGGGKSATFMLPAFASNGGTTVAIVPLVSLQSDLAERCRKACITTIVWSASTPLNASPSLLLVTPESFVTDRFATFLDELSSKSFLDRIVFDECHLLLDCTKDFRPTMLKVGDIINKFRVQTTFLTATMPKSDMAEFVSRAKIKADQLRVIRDVTTRPNIAYNVLKRPVDSNEPRLDRIKKQLDSLVLRYDGKGHFIVYVRTIADGKAVSEKINRPFYYSDCGGTTAEKDRMYKEWVRSGGVMVATNALGAGVDIGSIRGVLHVGMSSNLRNFAQESGRAGRDGQPSTSIVLAGDEFNLDQTAKIYIEPDICRRVTLDAHMDGNIERRCCNRQDEQVCDVCETSMATAESEELDSSFFEYSSNSPQQMPQRTTHEGMSQAAAMSQSATMAKAVGTAQATATQDTTTQPVVRQATIPTATATAAQVEVPKAAATHVSDPMETFEACEPIETFACGEQPPKLLPKAQRTTARSPVKPLTPTRPAKYPRPTQSETIEHRIRFDLQRAESGSEYERQAAIANAQKDAHDAAQFRSITRTISCAPCFFANRTCHARFCEECPERIAAYKRWEKWVPKSNNVRQSITHKTTMQEFGGCYSCKMPQECCDRWIPKEGKLYEKQSGDQRCHLRNLMLDFIYLGIGCSSACRKAYEDIEKLMDRRIRDADERAAVYFGGKIIWNDLEVNNLCKTFLAVYNALMSEKNKCIS